MASALVVVFMVKTWNGNGNGAGSMRKFMPFTTVDSEDLNQKAVCGTVGMNALYAAIASRTDFVLHCRVAEGETDVEWVDPTLLVEGLLFDSVADARVTVSRSVHVPSGEMVWVGYDTAAVGEADRDGEAVRARVWEGVT